MIYKLSDFFSSAVTNFLSSLNAAITKTVNYGAKTDISEITDRTYVFLVDSVSFHFPTPIII